MHIPLSVLHMEQLFLNEMYTRERVYVCLCVCVYFVYQHDRDVRASEISACPRKIVIGCIICMIDDIVLPVTKQFLSQQRCYVSFIHL